MSQVENAFAGIDPRLVVLFGDAGGVASRVGETLAERVGVPHVEADETATDWVADAGRWLVDHPEGGVLSCTALRREQRDAVRAYAPRASFVHLEGDAAAQPLEADETGVAIDSAQPVDAIVQAYVDVSLVDEG